MADVDLKLVKDLRAKSGAGLHKVKEALQEANNDPKQAMILLRKQGEAKAAKRSGNVTNNGRVGHYIHAGGNIGVLVELQSETDFAADSDKFQELAKELSMHIAAQNPEYVDRESIPDSVIATEKEVFEKDLTGKPEEIKQKILDGKLTKFYEQVVLLDQKYVRDEDKTISDLVNEYVAALGESVVIHRFVRFELGGEATIATRSSDDES